MMLTLEEKRKIKDILSEGLGINRNINLAYFLTEIDQTKKNVESLESKLNKVIYNQKIIDQKLDYILNELYRLKK